MTCHFRPSPKYLLKANEPAYFVTVVIRDGNKVSIAEDAYTFSSKSNLENTKEELENSIPKSDHNWEIACTEIKGGTTDAKREIFSRYGLRLVEPKNPSKEEWYSLLGKLVDLAKDNDFVSELDLAGSLAKGAASSKDADVLMFVRECPGVSDCEVFRKLVCSDPRFMNQRVYNPDPNFVIKKKSRSKEHTYSLDVYCLPEEEAKSIRQYRIGQHKRLLFKRKN